MGASESSIRPEQGAGTDARSVAIKQSIYPAIRYNGAKAAIEWLKSALGFKEHVVYLNDDGSVAHAELELNGNLIMLGTVKNDVFGKSPENLGCVSGSVYIGLDSAQDVEAYHDRAKEAGAEVVRELLDTDYGSREFGIRDPEGHIWSFGTYRPQAE